MGKRPSAIIVDVADKAKFTMRPEHPRQRGDGRVLYEAPLPMPPLRPGIGMDQVDASERTRWHPAEQFGGVARVKPDVTDLPGLVLRQALGNAVKIWPSADEAGIGKGEGLRDQMFAAAESDFEPDVAGRPVEQRGKVGRGRDERVGGKPRQQMRDQIGLVNAKLVALAPPKKRAAAGGDAIA